MRQGKVLFTSPVQPISGCSSNIYGWDKQPSFVRVAMSFLNHPGLQFLKANTSCDILEYPDAKQFEEALQNPPDTLGISFYINETNIAVDMARQARAAGVKEVWAGNFGAYTPGLDEVFDRVFYGWGEGEVSEQLGTSYQPQGLIHPEIYGAIGASFFPKMILSGILFTSRSCPYTCTFCQTPSFYGRAERLPLESIDKVLWKYHKNGVRGINILDENFGTFGGHSREVVDMLHKYRMRWIALTRVDTLAKNYDLWVSKGLFGAHLGVESLNESSLEGASKRIVRNETLDLLRKMQRDNLFVQAFYILGFPQDTVDSIKQDIDILSQIELDVVQLQVLTPYPKTGQRDEIESEFGINTADLSRYNSRNLVWNHPSISPEQMRDLQSWGNERLTSSRRALRTMAKFLFFCGKRYPNGDGMRLILDPMIGKSRGLYRQLEPRMQGAKAWATTGWYPYEYGAETFTVNQISRDINLDVLSES